MSPGLISVISAKSEEFTCLFLSFIEKYLFRSGWSSGISSPSARNRTMRSLSISMNLPYSAENTSGGGWPKFTKRKWPSGRISPYSIVAISRELSFASRASATRDIRRSRPGVGAPLPFVPRYRRVFFRVLPRCFSHHPALFALLHAPLPGLFRAQGASIHWLGFSGFLILSGPIVNTFDRF